MESKSSNLKTSETDNLKINGMDDNSATSKSPDEEIDIESILNGSKLSESQVFSSKNGDKIALTPVIVDFRRVIQSKSTAQVVTGVNNHELLHAVVGLYDVSLSEMTPDVLYNTVCEKWARSIILLRSTEDTLHDLEERRGKKKDQDEEINSTPAEKKEAEKEEEEDEDVWQPDDVKPATFADVYSDSDVSEEEESEEEEEEDFSKGINAFLETVRKRKKEQQNKVGSLESAHVGPESLIVAAVTFENTYISKSKDKVKHLTLLAVRKRFRKYGIGRFLLSQVKDPSIVGTFDAVVVHADNAAVDFFEKYGFTDDIVINSKWMEIAEQFTNCTLMSYLPPFTDLNHISIDYHQPELDLLAMEREIRSWRERSMEAYKAEVSCVNRLKEEVIHLRALASSQHTLIKDLTIENHRITEEKNTLERDYLEYRFIATKASLQPLSYSDSDDIDAEELLQQLELEVQHRLSKTPRRTQVHEDRDDMELDVADSLEEDEGDRKRSGGETYRLPSSMSSHPASLTTTSTEIPPSSLPKETSTPNGGARPKTAAKSAVSPKIPSSNPPKQSSVSTPTKSSSLPKLTSTSSIQQKQTTYSTNQSTKVQQSSKQANAPKPQSPKQQSPRSVESPKSQSPRPPPSPKPLLSPKLPVSPKLARKSSLTRDSMVCSSPLSFTEKFEFQTGIHGSEPLENAEETEHVTEQFLQAVKKDSLTMHDYSVKLVSKAVWLPCQEEEYVECLRSLRDPGMVTRLYYCGSLEKPQRIKHIFSTGFSKDDYSHGEYGHGLYFSKYPTKAAQFSVLGKLIVAAVGLGETMSVVTKDHTRKKNQDGADSIITPGRLFSHGDLDNLLCQEYVVFNCKQARPLYLIEYDAVFN